MSQDTRKDKRAKVVSLNVRYKSATVDEFIENHSYDVSKGGIFVKTPTPFPPGTLLKFEIRLAGDMSVIAGVGRVVWKREPTQAAPEKPAGMGVKFIKIDEASRALIDRLTGMRPVDAGSAYESEPAEAAVDPAGPHPSTLRGMTAAAAVDPGSPPTHSARPVVSVGASMPPPPPHPSKLPAPPGARPVVSSPPQAQRPGLAGSVRPAVSTARMSPLPPPVKPAGTHAASSEPPPVSPEAKTRPSARKATMMGMGFPVPGQGSGSSNPPATTSSPPLDGGMFPHEEPPESSEPVGEQTVMKQAAELLEEALKEAGGSMAEIEQNPLFSRPPGTSKSSPPGAKTLPLSGSGAPPAIGGSTPAPPPAGMRSAPPGLSPSAPPVRPAAGQSAFPSHEPSRPISASPAAAAVAAPRRLSDDVGPKSGGNTLMVGGILLGILALGALAVWKFGLLDEAPPPAPAPSASVAPPAAPSASAAAMVDASMPGMDAATAAGGSSRDAASDAAKPDAGSRDAGGTAATATAAPRPRPVYVKPKPPPAPTPQPDPPSVPTEATPTATPTAAPTPPPPPTTTTTTSDPAP